MTKIRNGRETQYTGEFASREELEAEILRLRNVYRLSHRAIGTRVGLAPGTVGRIINDYRAGECKHQETEPLKDMLNRLWRVPNST